MTNELVNNAMDLHSELLRWTRTSSIAKSYLEGLGMSMQLSPPDRAGSAALFEQSLSHADTYAVTDDIFEVIRFAAETIPDYPLAETDLPTSGGFVALETPTVIPDSYGKPLVVGAFTWFRAVIKDRGEEQGAGIICTLWTNPKDERDHMHEQWTGHLHRLWDKRGEIPLLLPMHGGYWEYGQPPTDKFFKTLMAFLRFVKEPYVDMRSILPMRQARRRAERTGLRTAVSVQVVELRRKENRIYSPSGTPVDWSHRWLVRPHWRQQWYASEQRHAPRWIEGYIKGPEGKPLVVKDKVFEVDR